MASGPDDTYSLNVEKGPEAGLIRVLHVDDDRSLADVTAEYLERECDRLSVTTETDPRSVIPRLDDEQVDCIVSDYQMPEIDGLELLNEVRAEYSDLPVILFTGKGSEAVASEAISAGVTDYLQKGTGTEQYELLANRIVNAVERARMERELNETQARFDALTGSASFAVVTINEDSVIQFANVSISEIFGYDPDELVGESLTTLIPERLRDAHREGIDRYLTDGERALDWEWIELPGLHEEGHEVPLGITFGETRTPSGRLFTGIIRDISDQKAKEQELREQRDRFRTIFENANDAIFVLDPDEETIVDANPAAAEMLGYSRAELAGMSMLEIHPHDMDLVREFTQEVAETEESMRSDIACRTKSGDEVPAEVSGSRIEYEGRQCVLVITRDVSDRRNRERELERQNERLEEFTSVVSHDLQNPLSVASARIDLASEECESEHLAAARDAVDRMDQLVEDLLELARTGRVVEDPGPVRLDSLAESVWETVDGDRGLRLALDDATVLADRDRLVQVFENLFQNVLDHAGPDPTVEVGLLDDRRGFYVADDGPGIPEGDRETVFHRGYTTSTSGTGFGLSIVREIVEAHGWAVEVTESADGGARFEISGVTFD